MKILPSIVITIGVLCLLSGCQVSSGTPPPPTNSPEQEIANPASENCIKQGGTLSFQERGDGGQYGICLFEDNRQCEEWALFRGDCPVGGLKVTGYITPAAQYCAVTGGEYQITGNSGSEDEQGTCTFKDGSQCDAWEYYNGICLPGNSANEAEATSEWQTYTNTEAGFIIQMPLTWSQQTLPDQNDGAIHGESFTGPEGGTEVYWGIGFGGACSAGTEPVQLSQAEVEACHVRNSDGTEIWEQIGYEVSGGNSFSVRAYTSNAEPASHDLVLQVLSTLTFMLPEQLQAGLTIQPLPVEVCDGQAQAMAHALNVLEVTQSEEPLEDFVSGVKGIGCQATVTGNGSQFESPEAVVNKLGSMLEEQGWTHDPMLIVGSSIGTGKGYRKDDQICLATAVWHPQDPTLCPDDQEITECQLEPEQKIYTITLNCGVETPQGGANIEVVSEQIVFDSTRAGDYRNLYLMNSQGKDLSRLTRAEADNLAGPWSPDGKRIIYTAFGLTNSYIAVVNADGSGQGTLSEVQGSDEGFPDWSPDGQRIAFTSRRDGNNEIYLMNADGSNPVRLTDEPGDDFAPSWSPDGSQIVFVSDRSQEAGIYDLFIMNDDGSGIRQLTDDTAIDYSPDWSPDGKSIAFRSDHDEPGDIWVINVDGSGLTDLTNDPADDWAPAWSQDGTRIAFQTNRDGNWEIYLMAADGTGLVNLTDDPADDQLPFWSPAGVNSSLTLQGNNPPITARQLVAPGALMGPGPVSFSWSPVGAMLAYVEPEDGRDVLWVYDAAAGDRRVLLDPGDNPDQIDLSSAQWSPQGDVLMLNGGTSLWLLDARTGKLKSLAESSAVKTSLTFSPGGERLAYVQENDIYTIGVDGGKIDRLTTDGSETVFNGTLDWVYNEELATRSSQPAYAWSPDGKWLIHLRLDEAEVQNHSVTDYTTLPPSLSYTRYPVAGSPNPKASLSVIALDNVQISPVTLADDVEYILPFFTWFPDSQEAAFVTVNRQHSVLELKAWNPTTGAGRTILQETDPTWVNENSYAAPIFLGEGQQFLWLSERDGFMHLYLYSRQGELIRQLTEGEWMIDTPAWNLLIPGRPVYVDPGGEWAYFSATKKGPLERQIYRVNIADGELEQVSQYAGFHFAALSGDGQYLVDQYSDVATPPVTQIIQADGTQLSVLGHSAGPTLQLPEVTREFVTIKAHDGVDLYAQIVKPENFDPGNKYPVIVHWYAGPTLQMVSNRYGKSNLFNHIERDVLYTQAGFIVWRLDNRGSFGRGHAFETPIARELGKAALDDQLAGIEYLRTLPFIDASRIGCDGKSFGGYMSLYALIYAPEVFKAGVVASAPTRWQYYDTIYTERYMSTPSQNPEGYAATDLIAAADLLQARPLIIHGLNDTNVHLQNSINLIQELEHLDKPFYFLPLPNLNHSYKGDGLVSALTASVEYFVRMLGDSQN